MNAGATFAKQYGLRPGVALSAAQMAQLTSDIVWLVEQSVSLPDGSTQRVLVPQVYVRVKPGDIDGSGALLSGASVDVKLGGDFTNSAGTVAGRTTVRLYNENVERANRLVVYDGGLKKVVNLIDSLTGSASSNGNTQRLILEATQKDAQLKVEMENYAANMASYETLLRTLENQQSILARASLRGKASPLGNVIQAGAFATAFR